MKKMMKMKSINTYINEKFKITKDIKNEENLLKKGDSFIMVFVKNGNVGHTLGTVLKRDYVSLEELEQNFKNSKHGIGGGTHYKAFKDSDSEEAKKYEEKLRKKI